MKQLVGLLTGLGRLRQIGIVAVLLVATIGGAFGLGVVGAPGVETVENRFTGVSENTTTIGTSMTVSNPNPVGVSLGGTTIDYTVSMNGVGMARGEKQGIGLESGNTTIEFNTTMRNGKIPAWWASHIANGERTQVTIDANVTDSLVGGRSFSVTQNRTIQTDLLGQFNSTETRPVNADRPFVSDPVLYINETSASWGRDSVTASATPMDMSFDVYNPKPVPYTVSKIGYRTYMNDVRVGSGETDSGSVIMSGERETIGVRNVIRNDRLDDWWVTHLQRNQNTSLYIDFYLVVEAGGEQLQVDLDAIDYEKSIETDMFGNKAQYPTGEETGPSDEPSAGDDGSTDSSGSDGSTDDTATPSDETPTDDGGSDSTPTDDGGLVGETL